MALPVELEAASLRQRRERLRDLDEGRTVTRHDLLSAREYDELTVAGKPRPELGATVASATVDGGGEAKKASFPSEKTENGSPAPARTCRGCGTPISGQESKIWCSNVCRKRVAKGNAPATVATPKTSSGAAANVSTLNGNGASTGHTGPAVDAPAVAGPQSLTLGALPAATNGAERLGGLLRALMLSGATVQRLDVTVAGEGWRIRRVTERSQHQ